MYDDAGTLVSGSFVDYLLPTAADTISFDIDHTTSPSTTNTLGTKGVGEAGTIASTPAVVNAVVDAVRHLGDQRHPDAVHARAGVEGDQRRAGGGGDPTEGAAMPHFDAATATGHRTARKERASDPRTVRLPGPDLGRGGARRPRRARRRRQDPRRRAEPAAGAADAAQRPRGRHRPRQDRLAARDPRRRRRDRHRRDDPARRGRLRPAGRRARRADHQGGRAPRRRPDPAPRHLRRRAGARRPGGRPRAPRRWRWARSS